MMWMFFIILLLLILLCIYIKHLEREFKLRMTDMMMLINALRDQLKRSYRSQAPPAVAPAPKPEPKPEPQPEIAASPFRKSITEILEEDDPIAVDRYRTRRLDI